MQPTIRKCGQFRQPLIKFIGTRTFPSKPALAHPHPAAPPEFQRSFTHIGTEPSVNQPPSKGSNTSAAVIYSQFWEAPSRFWQPRFRELGENEMDAIMSGGASSTQ